MSTRPQRLELAAKERQRLAALAGVNEAYLYQCLTGRRDMNPAEARRVEDVTDQQLRRWDICQRTWHLIWPELIGIEGAPEVEAPTTNPGALDEAEQGA